MVAIQRLDAAGIEQLRTAIADLHDRIDYWTRELRLLEQLLDEEESK